MSEPRGELKIKYGGHIPFQHFRSLKCLRSKPSNHQAPTYSCQTKTDKQQNRPGIGKEVLYEKGYIIIGFSGVGERAKES